MNMRIGIDIGGTNISLGVFDNDFQLLRTTRMSSFRKDEPLDSTLQGLKQFIEPFISPDVESIGIGVPSALDRDSGVIYNAVNIPAWKNVPLKCYLEDAFRIPVNLNNDSNCFALGASRYFFSEKASSLVGITLGTGVGMGIIIEGKLYNGNNTGAGEIGCIPYLDADLETYCSSHFFTRHGTDCKKAAEALKAGSQTAKALFEEFSMHLAKLVSTVLYAYDPEILVFGGGISLAFPYFKDTMLQFLQSHFIYSETLEKLKIKQLCNDEVALTGAAFLERT